MQHLGIIADGNRRWAKSKGLPSIEGHRKGLDTIEMLVEEAAKAGIPYISFFVFSTENWGRSKEEVDYLMGLIGAKITKLAEKMAKNNIRLLILGSRERVSTKLLSLMDHAEEITKNCTGLTACFCFNYGGEQEIADAAVKLAASGTPITPESIRANLYHPEVPNVDMVLRTSGEERTSGFMLWRSAYAEFLFWNKYFPEMERSDIAKIIEEYNSRNRRFGK